MKHLENMMTAKAWKLTMMISEHLLYQQVCAKALGQDISIYYIQGMLEGYVFSFLECLMDFVSTPDIMHKVGNRKNLTDQYIDYLIANKERYVNELAVPAEKLEIEVDEWYGGFKAFIPQYRISEIADSKEAAIELARNAYKKGQSRWILWRINEEYPGYADV